jgi:hypothetical protein
MHRILFITTPLDYEFIPGQRTKGTLQFVVTAGGCFRSTGILPALAGDANLQSRR